MVDEAAVITVYATKKLSDALDKIADKESRTKSAQCEYILKKYVEEYGKVG